MGNNTMSIYAQALAFNKQFKKNKINAGSLGFAEFSAWKKAIVNALNAAYKVAEYRHNNMGNKDIIKACDMTPVYEAIRPIIRLIGEVNGDTLRAENVAEMFVAKSIRYRGIDITEAMAHARCNYTSARDAFNNAEQGTMSDKDFEAKLARLEKAKDDAEAEVKRLEDEPGNTKNIPDMQSETTFIKTIQEALGDAITNQCARPYDEIVADKAAREQARKDKRRANKNAKKNAK